MSQYVESLSRAPKLPADQSLTNLLTQCIGARPGLPSLNSKAQQHGIRAAMQEALTLTDREELGHLIRWVFNQQDPFWRDRISNATLPGRFFTVSLSSMLRQYRDDITAPNFKQKRLPQTAFMAGLRGIRLQEMK